jgi:hypothetical protein
MQELPESNREPVASEKHSPLSFSSPSRKMKAGGSNLFDSPLV